MPASRPSMSAVRSDKAGSCTAATTG
jgi:hypothetical protein